MISNAYNQWKESSTTKNATTNAMNGNMVDRSEKGCVCVEDFFAVISRRGGYIE